MTWPQRFPDRPSGSQFGWRTFQGKQTFHYGRDQPAGVGAIHRAHADGKVLVHGHDRVYGFYLVVEYTGAPGVRHHIHQLQDRGRALGAGNFKKGDQLGLVGDPLLNIPVSERFNHATYCGSTFSTGPHSHEEVRTATQIDAAIDPAGTQASNIWKTIEATQTTPAGGSTTPITGDIVAIHAKRQANGAQFVIEPFRGIKHLNGDAGRIAEYTFGPPKGYNEDDFRTLLYITGWGQLVVDGTVQPPTGGGMIRQ